MNKWIGTGRLVKDPELKFSKGSGTAVTKFTIAVNRFKKEDGADFLNCVSFGKTGETIANYMQKGSPILLEGHIQTGSYENKEGNKVYTTDVIVDRFEFVGSKSNNDSAASKKEPDYDVMPVNDDSIPF